jgi:hypothetical protein
MNVVVDILSDACHRHLRRKRSLQIVLNCVEYVAGGALQIVLNYVEYVAGGAYLCLSEQTKV